MEANTRLMLSPFNVGVIQGGLKVNMIPAKCRFEADFRLPLGMDKEALLAQITEIVGCYPQVTAFMALHPRAWAKPTSALTSRNSFTSCARTLQS